MAKLPRLLKPASTYPTVELAAAPLFRDADFRAWLNRRVGRGLATWHCGGPPNEMSDVFVTYDRGEGDEQADNPNGMPRAAWDLICRSATALGHGYCVVRLVNQE